jgi:hypothetical protein
MYVVSLLPLQSKKTPINTRMLSKTFEAKMGPFHSFAPLYVQLGLGRVDYDAHLHPTAATASFENTSSYS